MSKKVAVITIHGMGNTEKDYADELFEKLRKYIGVDKRKVHFGSVYYQDILQPNEERVFKKMKKAGIDYKKLRRFFLYGFSDAVGLEHKSHLTDSPYYQTQVRIRTSLSEAFQAMNNESNPVVFICHSLGGQVLNNYIWDAQMPNAGRGIWKGKTKDNSKEDNFLRLKSLNTLYTTGCNIPIFLSAWDEDDIKAVAHDSKGYNFKWHNYYDEDDVLGWPLKPLSYSYKNAVFKDHEINADGGFLGKLWRGWNPMSHGGYWTDRDFTKPVARQIRTLI
ncbi:hypothetical protein [Aliikangiella coralliicola]|uniref:DUF676 domain-containing protein n=1 Tax=Aliikangiella coralliicola TaxID=2592383 RepID=A0A545UDM3_9GAMM|nr:hypothetical protein [Aliikangiella coralliicola]TQV87572.1 hypothetical protein FLL46_11920 [Aliikangiella coralliicola]